MSGTARTALALALCASTAVLGCASGGKPQAPASATPAPPPVSSSPPLPTGPTASDRVDAALYGFMIGAMTGVMFGGIGAAVGATGLAVYGAVTGRAPLSGGGFGGGYPGGYGGYPGGYPGGGSLPRQEAQREADVESQIQTEVAKGDQLEDEIEQELRRQEALLKQIDREEKAGTTPESSAPGAVGAPAPSQAELAAHADPRIAPTAPAERDLPASIFEEDRRKVPKGTWGNEREVVAKRLSLDADRDGSPELVRYVDPKTGVLLYKEEDRNYDGRMDTWTRYEGGRPVRIDRDNDGDGKVDEWQSYGPDGRMVAREVDRDGDGKKDAFYEFAGGSLVSERHLDASGRVERAVFYQDRHLVRAEEDLDHDGTIDTWTFFRLVGDKEVVSRVEKDTAKHGKPDVVETYAQQGDKTVLTKREEDKNGDGKPDVVSIYEDGKLKERQIADPSLVPL
jgi:hypothetical protein